MPGPSTALRRLTGSIVALLLLAGCQSLDGAGQAVDRSDLVNDLVAQLTPASELSYSAEYQLPGGKHASITQAQRPRRSAYTYPGGKLTITADAIMRCDLTGPKRTCLLLPPPAAGDQPPADIFAAARASGLVAQSMVLNLLTAAALDVDAVVEAYDTTLASSHASCVKVRELANAAATAFDTCVTAEGVLGSFTGTVNGRSMELVLTRYRDTVDATAFDPPAGAGLIDRRPAIR